MYIAKFYFFNHLSIPPLLVILTENQSPRNHITGGLENNAKIPVKELVNARNEIYDRAYAYLCFFIDTDVFNVYM